MPQLNSHAAAVVDFVLEYVFGNHTGSVKMSEAAALVGMSVQLLEILQMRHGAELQPLGPQTLAGTRRRLLEHSDKAISEICYEVRFSNLSNFDRHFLSDSGETPRN